MFVDYLMCVCADGISVLNSLKTTVILINLGPEGSSRADRLTSSKNASVPFGVAASMIKY